MTTLMPILKQTEQLPAIALALETLERALSTSNRFPQPTRIAAFSTSCGLHYVSMLLPPSHATPASYETSALFYLHRLFLSKHLVMVRHPLPDAAICVTRLMQFQHS
jgi:hypothetical protein